VCACKHRHKAKNEWRRQSRWILEKNEWAIPIGIAHFVINSQSKRARDKELLVSCSSSLLMKGQTLFSADHLAFKGLILLICRFSDI
jgi:hypothetical protein